jgi:hypothetical protein
MPQNIEKSVFRKGEYVGYADGVWRVFRSERFGHWIAVKNNDFDVNSISASTLTEMSKKLDAYVKRFA